MTYGKANSIDSLLSVYRLHECLGTGSNTEIGEFDFDGDSFGLKGEKDNVMT